MTDTPLKRLGMLTPSSNTVLEPMTSAIMAAEPNISVHFSRLRVTEISVEAKALAQFHGNPMLEAAALLADARPDSIIWNGTSGGWTGLDADGALVAMLEEQLRVPVSTVTLALVDLLKTLGIQKLAFVTPYTSDVQTRIVETFQREGFTCVSAPHLGISENFAFGTVSVGDLDKLVQDAAASRPEVIIPYCTNLPATRHAMRWEAQYGIPVFDSVAIAARAALELSGLSPKIIKNWGSIFGM
jgi:maleate isomerase